MFTNSESTEKIDLTTFDKPHYFDDKMAVLQEKLGIIIDYKNDFWNR